jgi:phosphopantetheine adenylyltransferase
VVGMNPNKNYPVSPQARVDLVRRMLQDTPASKNVREEGMSVTSVAEKTCRDTLHTCLKL